MDSGCLRARHPVGRHRQVARRAFTEICDDHPEEGPRTRAHRSLDFTTDLEAPLSSLPAGSVVVIRHCYEPLAYVALWLPDDVPLIRLCSNFLLPRSESRLLDLAFRRTRHHAGPVYLLHSLGTEPPGWGSIASLPLDVVGLSQETPSRCAPLFDEPELQRLLSEPVLCPLRRL